MNKPLLSFATIILSIGFALFYVGPEYSLVQERSSSLSGIKETLNSSEKIKTLISETEKSLNSVDQGALDRFKVFLPMSIDPIRFANSLQHMGLKNRIILENIKIEGPTNGGQASSSEVKSASAVQGVVKTFSIAEDVAQPGVSTTARGGTSSASGGEYLATRATFSFVATYETSQLFLSDLEQSLGLIQITALSFAPVEEAATPDAKKIKIAVVAAPFYRYTATVETYSLQ